MPNPSSNRSWRRRSPSRAAAGEHGQPLVGGGGPGDRVAEEPEVVRVLADQAQGPLGVGHGAVGVAQEPQGQGRPVVAGHGRVLPVGEQEPAVVVLVVEGRARARRRPAAYPWAARARSMSAWVEPR